MIVIPFERIHLESLEYRDGEDHWHMRELAERSKSKTVLDDDYNVQAVFGVWDNDGKRYVWLIVNDAIKKHRKDAYRMAREWLEDLTLDDPSPVYTVVGEYEERNRRWCEALGFEEVGRLEGIWNGGQTGIVMELRNGKT